MVSVQIFIIRGTGGTGGTKMKAIVYISVHADLFYGKIIQNAFGYIREIYKMNEIPDIRCSRDFVHSSELDRFDALHDAHVIVVIPNKMGLDTHQQFEIKVWSKLQKKYGGRSIYVILQRGTDYILTKANLVEGKLREVSTQQMLENKKEG